MQNINQIQVLTKPLCRAQAIFYVLPNNERGTKYRVLTYSAKQTVREICRATFTPSQTRLRICITVSITVVQSIETPQTIPKTPQTTQNTSNFPHTQTITVYTRDIIYCAIFLGHSWPFRGGGGPGSSTGIVQEYIQG